MGKVENIIWSIEGREKGSKTVWMSTEDSFAWGRPDCVGVRRKGSKVKTRLELKDLIVAKSMTVNKGIVDLI